MVPLALSRVLLRRTRRRSRHRGAPRRSLRVALALVILGTGALASVGAPAAEATSPAVVVSASICARYDPNLVSGACLQYQSRSGTAYTWIGTYRATDGSVFFCIDYLYDSRINAKATRVSTEWLHNQLDRLVGSWEVAALNYLISTHAPQGTAGSANGNAAIALLIREVMSDGIRNDGTVVYQPGLKVHGVVRPLPGGSPSGIMSLAQQWWNEASQRRGPWTVKLTPQAPAVKVPVGRAAGYGVQVVSADGRALTGPEVTFTCSGPIVCPAKVVVAGTTKVVSVRPSALGTYTLSAHVNGPAGQGQLLKGPWSAHGGTTAINNGVQRGWIAQRVNAQATASGSAQIVKASPTVLTQAQPSARPGDALTDLVTVKDLPATYNHPMTATLYGPFSARPTATSCSAAAVVGTVTVTLRANGTFRTPAIKPTAPGYYVWTESLPGDGVTNPIVTPCGAASETTLVQAAPRVHTQLSVQQSAAGSSLRDTIAVADTEGATLDVAWSLLGPVAPTSSQCDGLDWSHAPTADSGAITAKGDGSYRTPPTVVATTGCYTYVEQIAATPTSGPATTPPGEASETTLVLERPQLHTHVSAKAITLPGRISDVIAVSGVTTGTITIDWRLLGPIAPGPHGCADLDWASALVVASGRIEAVTGEVRTPKVKVATAGCYTFAEHSAASESAAEADSAPGQPAETALVTRPPLRLVPEVPTGPSIPVGRPFGWLATLPRLWAA